MNEDLINRITYHLSSGGLFNPELADHLAVRNLLMECRDALAQRTWVGLTDEEVSEIIDAEIGFNSCWGPEETFARAIEAKLKEKNT
jgi:hypothetical protein